MGWKYEGWRHSLAAKGIKTALMKPVFTDQIPKSGNWIVEKKYDGTRVVLSSTKKGTRIVNRRGVDKTKQYPEFHHAHEHLKFKDNIKLDGEIIVLEKDKESFKELSSRNHLQSSDDIAQAAVEKPATFMAFDVLEKDTRSPKDLPLKERRKLLDDSIPQMKEIKEVPYSRDLPGFIKRMKEQEAEGVVFKNMDSPYQGSSKDWRKMKFKKENDYAVIGFTDGTGKREGKIGALVLAHNGRGFEYAGDVGTGFTDAELDDATRRVKALEVKEKPAGYPKLASEHKIRFVKPKLVARIEYGRMGSQGHIKEPVFVAWRSDITPKETHK